MRDQDTAEGHQLKVTSPRLDQEEFGLTPVGSRELYGPRERSDAAPEQSTKSSRATYEPDSEVVEQTEQAVIFDSVAAADGGQASE